MYPVLRRSSDASTALKIAFRDNPSSTVSSVSPQSESKRSLTPVIDIVLALICQIMVHRNPRRRIVGLRVTNYSITFCHQDHFASGNIVCAQGPAHYDFRLSIRIDVGSIPLCVTRLESEAIKEKERGGTKLTVFIPRSYAAFSSGNAWHFVSLHSSNQNIPI